MWLAQIFGSKLRGSIGALRHFPSFAHFVAKGRADRFPDLNEGCSICGVRRIADVCCEFEVIGWPPAKADIWGSDDHYPKALSGLHFATNLRLHKKSGCRV